MISFSTWTCEQDEEGGREEQKGFLSRRRKSIGELDNPLPSSSTLTVCEDFPGNKSKGKRNKW